MAIIPKRDLSEAEAYLLALIQDDSGIDLAELLWEDPLASNKEQIFRCWDFQYAWWRDMSTLSIDQCGRAVGKTMSIIVRGWAFGIQHPGAEMVVTAPEAVHLQPLTSRIEDRIKEIRLTRELLPNRVGRGFKHRPFQVDFVNSAKILGRIPQRDGKGVKGLHPLRLEMDEAQDFPTAGWIELVETLRHGEVGAQWRAHGVSRGVHDEFYRHSQPGSGWSVHRITGMHRPTWSDQERRDKIEAYGSRDSPDYKRNILGLHGDATNPLFVLHRLMACVDDDLSSDYNSLVYYFQRITDEMVGDSNIGLLVDFPGSHKQWSDIWCGMDVGLTNHPTEILVFGEETIPRGQKARLRLLSRLHLQRISASDQRKIVQLVFEFYNPRRFTIDRGGLGLPVYQDLHDEMPRERSRIQGYTADEKLVVGYDDHESTDDPKDFEIRARAKEYGYDLLRQYVDSKRIVLPWDQEGLLGEWQGSTWYRERSETTPYGKKTYNRGSFHTLDAAAMMIVGKEMMVIETMTKMRQEPERVPLQFV